MPRYSDIDPQDIDPETNAPYPGYSSPALDTSFHDHEMDVEDKCSHGRLVTEECRQCEADRTLRMAEDDEDPVMLGVDAVTERLREGSWEGDDSGEPSCTNPGGHKWAYTGTQYGGDDERWQGEGRCYCEHCGADGDA